MAKRSQKSTATREFLRANFAKTQFCSFHQQGRCSRGSECTFAHYDSEHRSRPDLTKTGMCQDWMKGVCRLSASECKFAHGHDDMHSTNLRAPRGPQSTVVPMPRLVPGNQEHRKLHRVKLERADNIFEEVSLDDMKYTPCKELLCSLCSPQDQAETGTLSSMTETPSHSSCSIPTRELCTITPMDSMQYLEAGNLITTLDSINIQPDGSCISTVESLFDGASEKTKFC